MIQLPDDLAGACARIFEEQPFDSAMSILVGSRPVHTHDVAQALQESVFAGRPELAAGLWLYVDDLDRSHKVSQGIIGSTGAYWHGIMHRREGDFSNSRYWMRRVAGHPILESHPELDPDGFIDAVAAANCDDTALVARQREEWRLLFEWCAANGP